MELLIESDYGHIRRKQKSALYSTDEVIDEIGYSLNLIEPKVVGQLDKLQKINEQIK